MTPNDLSNALRATAGAQNKLTDLGAVSGSFGCQYVSQSRSESRASFIHVLVLLLELEYKTGAVHLGLGSASLDGVNIWLFRLRDC